MSRPHLEEELSFREAALELGRKRDPRGRRLRAMVLARERQTGRPIAIRLSGPKEPKLRITLGALYRAFPELRPARVDDLVAMARQLSERGDARTKTLVQEVLAQSVEPRLVKLEKRTAIHEEYLRKLHALDCQELTGTAQTGPSR